MKKLLIIAILLSPLVRLNANQPYRDYLRARVYSLHHQVLARSNGVAGINLSIPHYQIPAGNVFCRMEDKLTRATKIWFAVGVK